MLFIAVIVVFYRSLGLSLQEIFILQAAWGLAIVASQIPSGGLADRFGYAKILTMSCLFRFVAAFLFSIGNDFWVLLLANIFIGTGMSFSSGTVEAIVYDSLAAEGKTSQFRKTMGKFLSTFLAAEALASIGAGFIAEWDIRATFALSMIPFAIGAIATFGLKEPPRTRPATTWHAIKTACLTLLKRSDLRWLILLDSFLEALALSMFWFTQPYLQHIGIPLALFGIIHAVVVASGALSARNAHAIETHLRDWAYYLLVTIILCTTIFFLGIVMAPLGILLIVLTRMCWCSLAPITADIVTQHTQVGIRASLLSIRGMSYNILASMLPVMFAGLADRSLSQAFFAISASGLVVAGILLLLLVPHWGSLQISAHRSPDPVH